MKNINIGLASLFLVCGASRAAEQTGAFPWNATEFARLFNQQAQQEQIDPIVKAIHSPGEVEFKFGDAKFQEGVKVMKDMDLLNGKFSNHALLIVGVNAGGLVTMITVGGQRTDPVNMFRTLSLVGAVYSVLNPRSSADQVSEFVAGLGLMRGDDDPSIGRPVTNLSKGGAFTCNNRHSSASVHFGCAVVPRS